MGQLKVTKVCGYDCSLNSLPQMWEEEFENVLCLRFIKNEFVLAEIAKSGKTSRHKLLPNG